MICLITYMISLMIKTAFISTIRVEIGGECGKCSTPINQSTCKSPKFWFPFNVSLSYCSQCRNFFFSSSQLPLTCPLYKTSVSQVYCVVFSENAYNSSFQSAMSKPRTKFHPNNSLNPLVKLHLSVLYLLFDFFCVFMGKLSLTWFSH